MKTFLAGAAIAASAAAWAGAQEPLSFEEPGDVVQMMRKIWCSTEDGATKVFYWEGEAYSRRQGEADRKLFRVQGMNIRQCGAHEHETRGAGARTVSREILLYLDPETDEVLSTWDNPWTGETVEVLHVANDPVNGGFYPRDRAGEPTAWGGDVIGDHWSLSFTVPLFYPNPLAGDFQAEVGGTYHATEMFSFFGDVASLTDPAVDHVPAHINWVRISDWLPWMKMNGREGEIYFSTSGRKLDDYEQMSDLMKAEIAARYPDYAEAPPLDDERANMTSWKYYKGVAEGAIEAPSRD
ncbi:MAG: DUF1838 domain-containing protein [Caulobacterales bacterium]|nr:DUF1838 domain-containing protein [Caulobacterales bacterium]